MTHLIQLGINHTAEKLGKNTLHTLLMDLQDKSAICSPLTCMCNAVNIFAKRWQRKEEQGTQSAHLSGEEEDPLLSIKKTKWANKLLKNHTLKGGGSKQIVILICITFAIGVKKCIPCVPTTYFCSFAMFRKNSKAKNCERRGS